MQTYTHFRPPAKFDFEVCIDAFGRTKMAFFDSYTSDITHMKMCLVFWQPILQSTRFKVPLSILIIVNTVTVFLSTVFENRRTWSKLASFWNLEACSQTALPDRSMSKLVNSSRYLKWTKVKKKAKNLQLERFLNTWKNSVTRQVNLK